MAREKRRRYDDDDDEIDLSSIQKKPRNHTLILVLAGGIVLVLLTCLAGVGGFAIMSRANSGSQPDEFVGSWKARWTIGADTFDSTYTFNKNGSFREASFDLQGRLRNVSEGRWRVRNGQVEINWNNGSFEHATATHVDPRTINYRIVNHTDQAQLGLVVTLRRQ